METFKEFRNILLGQQVIVHTDHKNLIHNSLTSDRVMRWRLYIEEYGPEIRYIPGPENEAADAISRLPKDLNNLTRIDCPNVIENFTIEQMADTFCYNIEPEGSIPITYKEIRHQQRRDPTLLKMIEYPDAKVKPKNFHGGGKRHNIYVK